MQQKTIKSFCYIVLSCLLLSTIFSLGSSSTVYSKSKNTKQSINSPSTRTVSIESYSSSNNIKLNVRNMKLIKGKQKKLTVSNLNANYVVSYASNNKTIATVDKHGYVTGKKNGTTSVVATIKFRNRTVRKLTCSVSVGPAAVSIVIPKSKITLNKGNSCYINYIVKPSNTEEVPIFTSSNKKIATVSPTGKVTTHKIGEVIITAKISNGKSDTCRLIIKKAPVPKKNKSK
ncbi:MAG: Ig-like domain-containing protein [bacterium]|nr:Ig-like domain-containing protein [bacterium]